MKELEMADGEVNPFFALQILQLNQRIDDAEGRAIERFGNAKDAVAAALAASQVAIAKSEAATEKRFEAVNEFRETLSDQNREFVRSIEYTAQHAATLDKIDVIAKQATATDSIVRSKLSSVATGPAFLIGIMSVLTVIILAIISGAIALGSLQTHVSIDTESVTTLQHNETARIVEHAGENVERGNTTTRQTLSEQKIKQLEDDAREKLPSLQALVERIAKLEIELKNGGVPK
jgi:hypothetical protein